jgi:uncharacterized protein YndB with AHSA1/START domain
MSPSLTDRIEKQILLRAPQSRVWRALTDAAEFGSWFRVNLEGPFVPGALTQGHVTYPGYEHITMSVRVERMDPETLFSFRWHPAAIDPAVDYSEEPTTLVTFTLAAVPEGTLLSLVESGFDQIPAARHAEAHRMNDGGWTEQMKNVERHLGA